MENLITLLELRSQREKYCLVDSEGNPKPMQNGSEGQIYSVEDRIKFELFGEFPLSPRNEQLMRTLLNIRMPKKMAEKNEAKEKGGKK